MSATLTADSLSIRRGAQTVLEAVDLVLAAGDRLGVVGPNGIGKSTLLMSLAGSIRPDGGSVAVSPPMATVGYLPQESERSDAETVREFLARRTGVAAADAELAASTHALAEEQRGATDRYSTALDRWTSLGAADFEARVGDVLADLGTSESLLGSTMGSLSGGEAARIALASLLLSRFDVLLLDEPTNDLDLAGLERLERWILSVDAPVALVSHDRAFLSRVVTGVVEIDHHSHRATRFNGGWDAFVEERARARRRAQERYDEYVGKRQALLDRSQRQREWATRGAANLRRSSENDKNIRAYRLDQTEQLAGKAARTERALERLDENDRVEEPRTPWELRLAIPTVGRSGDVVATLRGAQVVRGSFRLGPVDLTIAWGDRVAITGANGAGKSTLVGLVLGRLEPDAGVAALGSSVVLGEIEQARTSLVGDAGLLDAFIAATGHEIGEARSLLAKFRLGPDHLARPGRTLSPGERTRAALAVLQATGANLLVLDEPTNHLDLEAIEQLEQALSDFAGTVLLVTHDRSMLERVEITRTLHLEHGLVREQ